MYHISPGNLEMIETARRAGACANFAGSGGAIVGVHSDESAYRRIEEEMKKIGVGVVKPKVQDDRTMQSTNGFSTSGSN